MSAEVVFIDTETTGLDPDRHEVWEIGMIYHDGREWVESRIVTFPAHLETADSTALRMTDFYKVSQYGWGMWFGKDDDPRKTRKDAAFEVARITAGKHLVGAVPSFDAAFLTKLLHEHKFAPAWHYHLVDVEALAAGRLGVAPPWNSDELARALGVERLDGKHTALGDARWAKAIYDAVVGAPVLA